MTQQNLPTSNQQTENVYEEAMNAGHAAAWEQDWDKAIPAYMLAIRVRPEDPGAHNNLGLALLQAGRLEDSLRVYQRSHKLAPDDPIPLEKSADVFERMGRLSDASRQYLAVAEVYLGLQDLDKAIGNWERASRISSGHVEVHKKLALAYERTGRKKQAVREYLTLASNYQIAGNSEVAIQAIERALRLEPQNPQALNALQALRSGSKVLPVSQEAPKHEAPQPEPEDQGSQYDFGMAGDDVADSNADGPLGESMEKALEALATDVMESGAVMEQRGMLTIQAIELHRQESYDEAIAAYKQAQKSGMNHPAISYNIGALNIAIGNWKEASEYLDRLADEPNLVAGAQHGLGIAQMQLGNTRRAAKHLIQALKYIDVSMTLSSSEADQLNRLYDRMMQNLNGADEKTLSSMNMRFFDLLTGVDWKQNIELTRNQLEEVMSSDPSTLLDVASVSPGVIQAMHRVDEYIRARRYNLAMEEAYYVLEAEPDYLAAHLRIGEVLVRLNRIQQAIEKYNQISRTFLARGNRDRAGEVLAEVIKVAPADVSVRLNLIELLEEEENYSKLLPEYIYLGDAYMDVADTNNARDTYNHAIAIARQLNAPPAAVAQIMHKLIDIDVMRLEFRNAMRTAEQIKQMNPNDQTARELLIDLNFRMGDPESAINELDTLLQQFAAKRDGKSILQTLGLWTSRRPDDEAIRSRLAAIYHQVKQREKAIEQYNILLNLQLNNGRHKDACQTIARIMTLNPPTPEKYQQLHRQLGCN